MQHLMTINSLYCSTVQVFFPLVLLCYPVMMYEAPTQVPRWELQRPRFAPSWSSRTAWPCSSRRSLAFPRVLHKKTLEKGHTLRELGVWTTFWSCKCWSYFIRILYSILKGLDSIYQVLYAIYIYIYIYVSEFYQLFRWTEPVIHPMIGWLFRRGTGRWNISASTSRNIFES